MLICQSPSLTIVFCMTTKSYQHLKDQLQRRTQWPGVLKTYHIAERVSLSFSLTFVFKWKAHLIYCCYYKINRSKVLYCINLIFIIFEWEFNYFHEFLSILFINLHYCFTLIVYYFWDNYILMQVFFWIMFYSHALLWV